MKKKYFLTYRFWVFLLFFFFLSKANAQVATLDISGNYNVSGYSGLWWDYQYKPTGSSTVVQSAIMQSTGSHPVRLNPFASWDFKRRYYNYYGQPQAWSADYPINSDYAAISKSTGYNFNFDTSAITEGWRGYRLQNTTSNNNSNIEESPYLVNGGTGKSIYMGWTSGYGVMLVSPRITDLATDKKFSVYGNYYQGSNTVILGTITDPYDPATFHPLKTVTFSSGSFIKTDVFLNNYNGQDQYIAIKSTGNSGDIFLDDFSYEQSVNCFDVTNVNVGNIQEHSAQLNFTASSQTTWEVSLKNLITGLTDVFTTTDNPYILNNLSGNTSYQVKMRADCGSGLYSNLSPTIDFTTPCSIIAAGYSTSFLETTYLNPCWKKIESESNIFQAPIVGNTSITPRTGSRYIYMSNSNTSSTQKSYLITPYISDLDNNKRIKLFLVSISNGFDYNVNSLTIGTLSNSNDASTFVPLKTISPSEMNEINGYKTNSYWKEHIVYLDNYDNSLGHHYIAIKQNNLSSNSIFHIDDFTYESIPTCKEPVNLKLIRSDFESATVTWENNNVPNNGEWEIQYGVSGFTIGSGMTVPTTSNPTILTNLTAFVNYDFYVRSKCGTTYSNWSDRGIFKTKCTGVTTGYAYDFENDSFDLNTCWSRTTPDIINRSYTPSSFINYSTTQYGNIPSTHSGAKAIRLHNNQNSPDLFENEKTILITPRLPDLNNERKISFWGYVPSNNYSTLTSIQVGTLSDPEDYTTFAPHENITSGFGFNQWKNYTVDFSNYYGTNKFIGIRISNNNTAGYVIYIDDFIYTNSDCSRPSSLIATQSGANSATLSWNTNNSNPVNCEIEYGILGFAPGTGTLLPANTIPFVINNLNPNTKYQYRVRNLCSSSVINWSNSYDFKISCLVNAPFEENFDQYPATNGVYIPDFCWTINENYNEGIYGGVTTYSFANFNSSPNSGYLYNSNEENKDAYYISPYLNDLDNTKRVKFWVNKTNNNSIQILSIGTLSNPLDFTTYTPYQVIDTGNLPAYGKEINVDFSNYSGTNKYVAFKLTGNDYSNNYYIDDFKYLNQNTCLEPINVQFLNISDNSALVKWDNTNGENVQIEYGVSGFVLGTGTVVNSSLNEKLITNLQASTQYDFYFKTTCSSGLSILIGPKKFKTTCNLQSLPWSENFNNLPQYGTGMLPDCFSKLVGGTVSSHNTPLVLNTNYYDSFDTDDHTLNGNGDSSYLWINSFTGPTGIKGIVNPTFNLISGTTYKFSLDARKAYEYDSQSIRMYVGRGNMMHYMEAELQRNGILSEYSYNTNSFVFTPIVSGPYSFILETQAGGSTNMILDNFAINEGYSNIISNNTELFDFQNGVNNKLIIENTQNSFATILPEINNATNKLLKMAGSNAAATTWITTPGNFWESNQNFITKVNMKINASAMTTLFMNFDLKQTFNTSNDESVFRVIVNGNVLGNVLKPLTNNQDGFTTLQFDLTPFVGQDIRISLQHVGKSNLNTGDNAYLDNLRFGPTPLLGTNDNEFSRLKFYPNPVSNILNIENSTLISSIEILSVAGQSIFNKKYSDSHVTIDTKNFPSGIYFIKITSEDKSKVIKVVKE